MARSGITAQGTLAVLSRIGAERLRDNHPGRDVARGGSGEGHQVGREFPAPPEDLAKIPAWLEECNRIAREKYNSEVEIDDPLDLILRGFLLAHQAEMNVRLQAKYGRPAEKGKRAAAPLDTSKMENI